MDRDVPEAIRRINYKVHIVHTIAMKIVKILIANKILLLGCLFLLLLAGFGADFFSKASLKTGERKIPFLQVGKKSFVLTIMERGIVSPARISPISSQISSNQAKIVWLVKEGTSVKKGTLVARFDTKPFMDSLLKAEQDFADANATFLASEKLLSLQREEESGKTEEAVRKVEIAKIQGNNIENGSGPLKRKIFEQKLHQAERSLNINRSELDDLQVLLKKGHVSARERDKIADKVATAKEQVQVARAELKNFDRYTWPKLLREAELLVNGAESNLQRVKRTAELLIQNRAAAVEKNRRKVESKKRALEKSKEDVVNCDLYSPTGGILLYTELPRESGRRKIQIGDSVWVGQTFLQVPDTSELVAEIQIREVDVAKIGEGMRTEIELDAFPGMRFPGRVESIAFLAKEDDKNRNIRRFYTRIQFTGDTDNIHVGMSVTTRIIYQKVEDVLAVPVSAVIYRDGQTMVKKKSNQEDREVIVALGARGAAWVELLSGLRAGETIYSEGQ